VRALQFSFVRSVSYSEFEIMCLHLGSIMLFVCSSVLAHPHWCQCLLTNSFTRSLTLYDCMHDDDADADAHLVVNVHTVRGVNIRGLKRNGIRRRLILVS
jgi:hypothetical protein